jgi:hypothetical protein
MSIGGGRPRLLRPMRRQQAGSWGAARYLRSRGAVMTHSSDRDTTPTDIAAANTPGAVGAIWRPGSCGRPERSADEQERSTSRRDVVPSWDEVRHALFGGGAGVGLVGRCADDESLIAAALQRHPYLAAYCSHLGRERLARALIYEPQDGSGDRELKRLREAHETLAPVWRERWMRGLPVAPGDRGRRELRKPDLEGVLAACGAPTDTADRATKRPAARSSHRSDVQTDDRGIS